MAPNAGYHNDAAARSDALGFDDFRPALVELVAEADTPLTVGLYGGWGTGKSSLLGMLGRDLEARDRVRVVSFTAWKYTREEALWRAFVLRVLDALYPRVAEPKDQPWHERERVREPTCEAAESAKRLQRLEESVYRPVEWQELGRLMADWRKLGPEFVRAGLALVPGGSALGAAFGALFAKGEDGPDPAKALAAVRREVRVHRRDQLLHLEQFARTFEEAVRSEVGAGGRLVVLVDDLDRCLPEKAVEVLEAIKLFLDVPGTVFVLAMDTEVVTRGIEAHYKALFRTGDAQTTTPIDGTRYLEKLVQVAFRLPVLGIEEVERYVQSLAGEALHEITRATIARGVLPAPRQIKRALNIHRLVSRICEISPVLLAKTVLVQLQWPELYREWQYRPTLLKTLENEYQRRPMEQREIELGEPAPPLQSAPADKRPEVSVDPDVKRARPDTDGERGGLLGPYLRDRTRFARLEAMLAYPAMGDAEGYDWPVRFAQLDSEAMEVYLRLAGAGGATTGAEGATAAPSGDLLTEVLSGDPARRDAALAAFDEREADRDGPRHRQLRETLRATLEFGERSAVERAAAGDALAVLGDPRFDAQRWMLPGDPSLGFRRVPSGTFEMGDGKESNSVELPEYWLARFPVTVAQFRVFVDAEESFTPGRENCLKGLANHPVVWVSWDEALAYCRWLDGRLREAAPGFAEAAAGDDRAHALWTAVAAGELHAVPPSEAEWERAARGERGGVYPWGDEPDPERANYDQTGIGTTNAVGCFPADPDCSYGCEELSGNVWEWTRSIAGDYPYPAKGAERNAREALDPRDKVLRVLRGGAFDYNDWNARCAFRDGVRPDLRLGVVGFRVVLSPFSGLLSPWTLVGVRRHRGA